MPLYTLMTEGATSLMCLCCFLQFVGEKKPYKNISQLWDGEVEASANEE